MNQKQMQGFRVGIIALTAVAAALSLTAVSNGQGRPQKVVLRCAADFPPPPHAAGVAMKHVADRLPQVIPGSEGRLYCAGALYTSPEAFEAMRGGNLEM